jgi:probable phosphoglycerate mutase
MVKTKEIFIIRHGQTDYNKMGKVQGRGIDAPLNDLGRTQARAFYEFYKNEGFQKVYTSTLRRTIESVEGFLNSGLPHRELAGLDEIDWGNKEGKSFNELDHNEYLTMTQSWQEGNLDHRIDSGESPLDVEKRQKKAWREILSEEKESKILVCMHGRAMRILLSHLLNYPLQYMDMFLHENLCLYKLNFTGTIYHVELYNDTSHLEELPLTS